MGNKYGGIQMKLKTLCTIIALGVTGGNGCMLPPEVEFDEKIGDERVTQKHYYSPIGECSMGHKWRRIRIGKSDGSEIYYHDNDADDSLDYVAYFNKLGKRKTQIGMAEFDCLIYGRSDEKVTSKQQKDWESYRIKVRKAQVDCYCKNGK